LKDKCLILHKISKNTPFADIPVLKNIVAAKSKP